MKNGETRSAPRSRNTRCCSAIVAIPPIAEPTRIPTRAGSTPRCPRRPTPPARRRRRAGRCGPSGAPPSAARAPTDRSRAPRRRSAPGNSLASNASMKPMPLRPATAASHVDGASRPIGVTAPKPVIDNAAHEARAERSRLREAMAECTGASRRARPARPVPADGGRARARAPAGDGWAYEPKWDGFRGVLENARRRAAPLVAQRPAAAALLPGAPAARRAPAAPLGARRRDRDRQRRRDRLRRDADAAAPRREPHPQALRRDPGAVRRLRRARLGRRRRRGSGRSRSAAPRSSGTPPPSRSRRRSPTPRRRRRGSTSSRRSASTASSRSGSTGPSSRAAAARSSR